MYRHLFSRFTARTRCGRKARTSPRQAPSSLQLESLENRLVPAVFNVNSLADLLTPPAGAVTLRSALQAANATPGANTINLTLPGVYKITTVGTANETDNAAGELAYTGTGNLTILNTSGGAVTVDGGGLNRVLDINPAAENLTPFTVTLQGFSITGGAAFPGDAALGSGGGIRAQGAASIVLNSVVVTGNSATADGGGIALESINNDSTGALTINASTISHNSAGDAGGGIETDGRGRVTVNTGSVIAFNTCVNQGAGIWLDEGGAALDVTGTIISNNLAFTMLAGGIGNAGAGAVTLSRSLIQNNFAGDSGGGFGDAANMDSLTVQDCSFLNNTAVGNGGGIQVGGGLAAITGSTFEGNMSGGDGGAIFVNGQTARITNTVFRRNVAVNGGGVTDRSMTTFVDRCTFDSDRAVGLNGGNGDAAGAGGNGGGLELTGGVTSASVTSSLFLNNVSGNSFNGSGGGLFEDTGVLTILNSQFTGNVSFTAGGILFGGTTFTITGSTFSNNRVTGFGGALAHQNLMTGQPASSLIDDTFVANVAGGQSGAIAFGGIGTINLLNDTFNANTAAQGGGAITFNAAPLSVIFQNTIVAQNTVAGAELDISSDIGNPIAVDQGGNLIGVTGGRVQFGPGTLTGNPLLGLLQNNGGQYAGAASAQQIVQTEAFLPGSPAIGAGVASGAPATDERGFPRIGGGRANPSIGAFEPQFAGAAPANQILVENFFEVLLNRLADPGSAGFVNELTTGVAASTVALQIEGSSEYLGNQVQLLFQRYLHRQADAGSLPGFISLLSQGSTLEQVAATIAGSAEYFQLHGGNNVSFLTALYEDALRRTPDPFGQDSFMQMLAGGAAREAVALAVFTSAEFRSNFIGESFAQYLGRQAFPGDLANFTNAFQNGLTDQAFIAILLGSTEFRNGRA
jgi:predicted outer membrane repeat protein